MNFLSHDVLASEVGTDQPILIAVPRDEVPIFAARIGESIALCDITTPNRQVVGISTLRGLAAAGDRGDLMQAICIQHIWLSEPVAIETMAARLTHGESFGDADVEPMVAFELLHFNGLAEELSEFDHGPDPQTRQQLYNSVLRNYGYRCAITGAAFKGAGQANTELDVVALRPPDSGGDYHVNNYLAVTSPVKSAFNTGALTLADDLGIIADLARCPADLRALFNTDGRCRHPNAGAVTLSPANIRWHRMQALGLA